MDAQTERMNILERIERGEISVEQGVSLIETLPEVEADSESPLRQPDRLPELAEPAVAATDKLDEDVTSQAGVETNPDFNNHSSNADSMAAPRGIPPEAEKWKRFWIVPFWTGVALTSLGGFFMYWAIEAGGFGFWFICAALLFALGVFIITLAWQSQFSPWLHLRVQQSPGEYPQRIAFSLPLPVRPAAWFLRTFGGYIHGLDSNSVNEILQSIEQVTSSENPIYIQVDEGDLGEKVEIYIG